MHTTTAAQATDTQTDIYGDAMASGSKEDKIWYVLRDLTRPNALLPGYRQLGEEAIEVFTPMKWKLTVRNGKRQRSLVPFIHDLLFACESREILDPIIDKTGTLQYRYVRGGGYKEPMTVPTEEMERFIRAARSTEAPQYYLPGEITEQMSGRSVRIVGGALDGYEGRLLTVRGSKRRRLIVELANLLTMAVEVDNDYIEFV